MPCLGWAKIPGYVQGLRAAGFLAIYNVENVATTLALADQYHCSKLKDACIGFINSSNRMDNVLESQGYANLKRSCPALFVDMWEKAAKSRKI